MKINYTLPLLFLAVKKLDEYYVSAKNISNRPLKSAAIGGLVLTKSTAVISLLATSVIERLASVMINMVGFKFSEKCREDLKSDCKNLKQSFIHKSMSAFKQFHSIKICATILFKNQNLPKNLYGF